ncbi:MAG: response regulator [Candidatus Scalindua sp. AMX11]|nr:MAG: response regulator [Candidatus Scalindua sp.]NOG84445.1 response regulator [Planctomycetota bacterium]RZV72440.1 MAG: response regulator [Candidatus Scalindua sp. SCAELEC01]TDE64595.1 MAG: response regulator [Candidatus Scalindua sp. AMX11]GJQ57539.1 MAG: response regulator receiver modulated metal-depenent phosphohydrolase [Candidatus Scalindua sp.]
MIEKILFVDDDITILSACKRVLSPQYDVITADSGKQGIIELKENGPIAVVVSDFRMPEMNGIQFLSSAKQISPDTVRILLTGQADLQATIDAINEGSIFLFLTKPCENPKLIKALSAAIRQYQLVVAERELLERTLKGSIKLLSDILSMVSPTAFSCSSRMSNLAKRLASNLNIENIWEVELAAMFSQIGCVTIPGETLEKRNRDVSLSASEKLMFSEIPHIGRKLLSNIPRLERIADAVAYQEKQYDGGGIPKDDKKGTDIPLISRILKVVLDFDVMVTKGMTKQKALNEMRTRPHWYDQDVFAALENEIFSVKEGCVQRAIILKDVQPGMVLADDIKTGKGVLLVQKGHEITDIMITRLSNIKNYDPIVEPIKIVKELEKTDN